MEDPPPRGDGRRRRRLIGWLLGVPLVLLLVPVVMSLTRFADRMILYPTTAPADAMGAARREIPFEGGVLEIWTARAPGAMRASLAAQAAVPAPGASPSPRAGAPSPSPALFVLSFEGNASRAEWSASPDAGAWGERDVEVWSVNYPGYGGSTGPAHLERLPRAALAAYDALAREAAGRPIAVNGSSLGSTLALYVAAQRPVAGMLLRNPPPLQDLILSARFGWWNLWIGARIVAGKVPVEMNSLLNAPKVTAPAVFLLSTADEVVPPPLQRKIVDAYAGEKRLIEMTGASHNAAFDGSHAAQLQAACAWLWERAARPGPKE